MVLKNGRSGAVECDGDMLLRIIQARGFNPRELSTMLGYEQSYFSKVLDRNRIGSKAVIMLAEQFGIKPQQYKAAIEETKRLPVKRNSKKNATVPKTSVKATVPDVVSSNTITVKIDIDTTELSAIIKKAVIEAFNSL